MISKIKTLSSVFAFMLLLTVAAFGQETTGNIEVTVTDPSSARVPGASIVITGGSVNRTVTADEQGFARIQQLQPGIYTVAVSGGNFRPVNFENVEVVLGKTTPINAQMQAGGIMEAVEVSASDVAPIDPTDNTIQTNITERTAELLPKGVNFTSLLQTAPAVRNEPLSGGFQIDGASGSENTFIIDGQEVTNFRTGVLNANNNIPFQFVQEVQIKSSGFDAEFGGATGGVINVVTKSGSNDWRGEFGMQFRPGSLQSGFQPTAGDLVTLPARRFLRRFNNAAGAQVAEYLTPRKDAGTDIFPTANLSGPVINNRLWFFGSFTPQFQHRERTLDYITSNPATRQVVGTETYTRRQRNDYGFARLDASVSDKLRLTGTYLWNPIAVRGALDNITTAVVADASGIPSADFGGQIGVLRGASFLNQQGGRQNSNNITGQATWTPTSNMVVNFRGGRSFLNEKLNSYGIPRSTRFICAAGTDTALALANGGCTPGQQNFASNFQIDYDVSVRKTFDADASYLVSDFGGRHQFKFGYQYNGLSNATRQGYRDEGIVQLFYGFELGDVGASLDCTDADHDGHCDAVGAGFLQRFATEGAASSSSQSFFIQDSWQPTNRLSLNLGLRFEKEDVPTFNADFPGISFGLGDKIAPRLGVAYDLTGDGKTKLFASYGWFYDRFKYELPRGSFGGDFFRRDYFEIFPGSGSFQSFTFSRILGTNQDVFGGQCPIPNSTGLSVCQNDFRIPSNRGLDFLFESGAVDPNLKAARQTEFTVGFERDLGSHFVLASRYTRKNVDRAIEDIGIPTPEGSEAYIIGNPGMGLAAEVAAEAGFPSAKAQRQYDAFEVRLDKRFSDNYYFNVNYTYSRLYGNYSGLASSDEGPNFGGQQGRNSPNVNRFFDLPFLGFTANGDPDNGRLATDRPHVLKFNGSYNLPWTRFGSSRHSTDFQVFTTAQSGTPLTTVYNLFSTNVAILNGRGDLGRTEAFTQTDFAITHTYRFGKSENKQLKLDLNILNLFNEANVLNRYTVISPTNFSGTTLGTGDEIETINRIFNGGIRDLVINAINAAPNTRGEARYNQDNAFQVGRDIRFGFRFIF